MVHGGMSCVKYILFAFNLIFVIFGGLLIYFGVDVIKNADSFKEVITTPNVTSWTLIVVGAFVFLIAFLGCCGAIRENHCMLISFGVVVFIILVIELAAGGCAFAFKSDLVDIAQDAFNKTMSNYKYNDMNDTTTKLVDDLQMNAQCCGILKPDDWFELFPRESQGVYYPDSCCDKNQVAVADTFENGTAAGNVTACTKDSTVAPFHKGCVYALKDALHTSFGPLAGVALAVAIFQLLGIVFACCMAKAVKKEYEVV